MAVFRIEKTRDYTVMSNHHLRNAGLSLKSKRAALHDAVFAGGLELYHQGAWPKSARRARTALDQL